VNDLVSLLYLFSSSGLTSTRHR